MSTSPNGSTPANIAGALLVGLAGAMACSAVVLATGHGFLMALLAYSLTGSLLMPAAAVAPIARRKARARLAHLASLTHGHTHPA